MGKYMRRGFTLMELLMVIVVIGILAGLLLPVLKTAKEEAKKKRARLECGQLETAFRSYFSDNRAWTGLSDGSTGSTVVQLLSGQSGGIPYMEFNRRNLSGNVFVDPWGSAYQFKLGNNNQVSARGEVLYRVCAVWSMGPNGQTDSNGTDDDDDILSWK